MGLGMKDWSGTITTGGVAQTAAEANIGRAYILVQNLDPDDDLWVSFTETAAANNPGSILLVAGGGAYTELNPPTGAISVLGATTGNPFTIYEG